MCIHLFLLGEKASQITLTIIMLKVIHDLGKKFQKKPKNVNKKENFLFGEGRIFFLKRRENGSKEKSEIILSNEILGYVSC